MIDNGDKVDLSLEHRPAWITHASIVVFSKPFDYYEQRGGSLTN